MDLQDQAADMPEELLEVSIMRSMNAPASTLVYRQIHRRMQSLKELRKLVQGAASLATLPKIASEEPSNFDAAPSATAMLSAKRASQSGDENAKAIAQAQDWLLEMLDCHERLVSREQVLRLFRSAIEKDILGRRDHWTEKEQLYMVLSEYDIPSLNERFKSAVKVVLRLDLAKRMKDVRKYAAIRADRPQRATNFSADTHSLHEAFASRVHTVTIDHFACAVPLSQLVPVESCVIDANAGCCPICQNSYTALDTFTLEELINDYPVRIKYCGHIIGKGCLTQWMMTPKIDEAKYPHRTCPLCRVEIEGVEGPIIPNTLRTHLHYSRQAMETVRALVIGWDLEQHECFDSILATMSNDIACEELMGEIQRRRTNSSDHAFEKEIQVLHAKKEMLRKEKWAWGFRGNALWRKMRNEWMVTGTVRKD